MKNVFPPEIIGVSVENHFSKFSKSSQLIYLSLVLLILAAGVSTLIIKVDITIPAKGLIRSNSEQIKITSPVISKVTKVTIDNNQFVNKGDTLIWMNTAKFENQIAGLQNLTKINNACLRDIEFMLNSEFYKVQTDLYISVCNEYRQKLSDYDMNIEELQTVHDRTLILYKKGVIPKAEQEKNEFRLKSMIEEKNIYIRLCYNEWEQAAKKFLEKKYTYNNEIESLKEEIKNYYILAPGSGYIVNYTGINAGSYTVTGQVIASISPAGRLVAEHYIPPEDIGLLHKGMEVIYQIDAYNYNEWGLASGFIIDISNEIYMISNKPFFKVHCNINETYLTLRNGQKGCIKKGLTTTTRFRVTKRTIFQLIFDKTVNWLNPATTG